MVRPADIGISFAMPPLRAGTKLAIRRVFPVPFRANFVVLDYGHTAWLSGDRASDVDVHARAQAFVNRRFCGERPE